MYVTAVTAIIFTLFVLHMNSTAGIQILTLKFLIFLLTPLQTAIYFCTYCIYDYSYVLLCTILNDDCELQTSFILHSKNMQTCLISDSECY